ncbi:hypothetical protein [uncultured Friedmanniella sp.]|uniref:hypothetical protein n=1 Tax=uncultured Friedmanniella sp. TaxID=335381 RepID=UPI0035CB3531
MATIAIGFPEAGLAGDHDVVVAERERVGRAGFVGVAVLQEHLPDPADTEKGPAGAPGRWSASRTGRPVSCADRLSSTTASSSTTSAPRRIDHGIFLVRKEARL